MNQVTSKILDDERRWTAVPVGLSLMGLIGLLDWYTPVEITITRFYVVPVGLIAWFISARAGLIAALLSAFVALALDLKSGTIYDYHYAPYGNALTLLVFLLLAVFVLRMWKDMAQRLQHTVTDLREEIAERERANTALNKLAVQLSEAEDNERRRIAYDIHDGLSQTLSLVKMNLEAAAQDAQSNRHQHDRLIDSRNLVDEMIRQTRSLTFDLHPSMLDDLGLVPTLHWFAEQFAKRTNIEVEITENGPRQKLPSSMANYLFRAIKELISNGARHGKAKEILVAAHWATGTLRIVVDDDGCGFDPVAVLAPKVRRGLGLAGIHERLLSFGAHMRIESQDGQGTRVVLEIPLGAAVESESRAANSRDDRPADAVR